MKTIKLYGQMLGRYLAAQRSRRLSLRVMRNYPIAVRHA